MTRASSWRRSILPLAGVSLAVLAVAGGVFTFGVGVDLLLVGFCILFLVALDRIVGDRLAESFGSGPASVILGLVVIGFAWYVIVTSDRFFAAAEKRGYRSLFHKTAETSAASPDDTAAMASGTQPRPVGGHVAGAAVESPMQVIEGSTTETTQSPDARKTDVAQKDDESSPPLQAAGSAANRTTKDSVAGTVTASTLLFGSREEPVSLVATAITLRIVPPQVFPARRAFLESVVVAQGRPVSSGSVDFVVNGVRTARVAVGANGRATTVFATSMTGEYDVRAHFSGTASYEPSSSQVGRLRVAQSGEVP